MDIQLQYIQCHITFQLVVEAKQHSGAGGATLPKKQTKPSLVKYCIQARQTYLEDYENRHPSLESSLQEGSSQAVEEQESTIYVQIS